MTKEKFIHDTQTVLKFIQIYCEDKHKDEPKFDGKEDLIYNNEPLHVKIKYHLCSACRDTFYLSYHNLQECPHEEKPSCRKCPKPCYDRPDWKHVAKIMKYSGMKQGLLKIRKLFKFKSK